jgi:fucose 4-O-acetylase-like acetyltransferase
VASFVNSFVLFFFFAVVPLLSIISGWLFFSGKAADWPALRRRIGRRIVSLYLPLVIWNLLLLALLLALFRTDPGHPLLPQLNIDFRSAGPGDYLNAVFGFTAHPIGFQFWFVRDLFVTVLVSPLLWLFLRHAPWLGAALLGAAWIAGDDLWIFFRTDVPFFFFLGGLLRQRGSVPGFGWRMTAALVGLYLALVALRVAAPLWVDESVYRERMLLEAATRAMRLPGVLACWGLFLNLSRTPLAAFGARFGGLAFFLHGIHYPLLAEVKILLWRLVPAETDGWMLAHYAASVVITVAIGLCAGIALARAAPRAFALFNGGRAIG